MTIPLGRGRLNIRRETATVMFSERYGLVPSIVVLGFRFTWRKKR
jgi:hypothetical protein